MRALGEFGEEGGVRFGAGEGGGVGVCGFQGSFPGWCVLFQRSIGDVEPEV